VGQPADIAQPGRRRACTLETDAFGVVTAVDDAGEAMLDRTRAEIVGRGALELVHPDDQPRAVAAWAEMLAAGGAGARLRLRLLRRDGGWRWVEVAPQSLLDDPDRPRVVARMAEVAEADAWAALVARERLLDRVAEALPLGIVHVGPDGRAGWANARLRRMTGAAPGAGLERLLAPVLDADREALEGAIARAVGAGEDAEVSVGVRGLAGALRCRVTVRALAEDPAGALVWFEDVTEWARAQADLLRRATVDGLTGCLNRTATLAGLERALDAAGPGTGTAVVYVDLDCLKGVNDRLGHAVGDEVLAAAGRRLRGALRASGTAGRVGGDEFVLVCPDVPAPADALAIGRRVAASLNRPVRARGRRIPLTASVGVAFAPAGPADASAVLSEADRAMYASKRAGRGEAVLAAAGERPDAA
jgi:diguanylate cyclase (GGDEF)-like protein/PAS domain S-box-containing protein